MLLSEDILTYELSEYVLYQKIAENSCLEIASFLIWDSSIEKYSREYLYVVLEQDSRALEQIPAGMNVLCNGALPEQVRQFDKLNLVVIRCLETKLLINKLLSIFQKYVVLENELREAVEGSASLQKVVNAATKLIGYPIAMIDMNHNTLAYSTNLESEGDILWDAILEGYGYRHFSVVYRSIPNLAEMDVKGNNVYQGISNISNQYIRVYLLRQGTRGCAAVGLHKHRNGSEPFEKHAVQLADYFVDYFSQFLERFPEIQKSRGNLFEQFLADLLDGEVAEAQKLEQVQVLDHMNVDDWYVLGVVKFKDPIPQTDYYLKLMDDLESSVIFCKCTIYQSKLYFTVVLHKDNSLSAQQKSGLLDFINRHKCYCILSSPFKGLFEVSKHKDMIWAIEKYIQPDWSSNQRIYYYHQYVLCRAIELLSKEIPLIAACHPLLQRLMQYDEKNNSNYVKTLDEYLKNNCNVTKASKVLHMHRNSLLYRINKIEESILGLKLEDNELREELKFSFRCLEYMEAYQREALESVKESNTDEG
jgi:hypothetical protein